MITDTQVEIKSTPTPLTEKQQGELARLREFQPTLIGPWLNNHLASLPDLITGKPIIYHESITNQNFLPAEWFTDNGSANPPVEYKNFTPDQTDRLLYAHHILKLPAQVVTHLVMNQNMTKEAMLQKFGIPAADTEIPCLISLGRLSLQRKTTLAAALRQSGEKVVSLCGFSGDNLEKYWASLGDHPESLDLKDVVAKIQESFNSEKSAGPKNYNQWTAQQALDRLCDVFVDGNRPDLVICDMPGYRQAARGEEQRMMNIFDIMGKASMDMIELGIFDDHGFRPEGSDDWRVIDDYLTRFRAIRSYLVRFGRHRNNLFSDLVTGNDKQYYLDTAAREITGNTINTILDEIDATQPISST